eukprot:441218-Pyramimonas_sp.AAC.1
MALEPKTGEHKACPARQASDEVTLAGAPWSIEPRPVKRQQREEPSDLAADGSPDFAADSGASRHENRRSERWKTFHDAACNCDCN